MVYIHIHMFILIGNPTIIMQVSATEKWNTLGGSHVLELCSKFRQLNVHGALDILELNYVSPLYIPFIEETDLYHTTESGSRWMGRYLLEISNSPMISTAWPNRFLQNTFFIMYTLKKNPPKIRKNQFIHEFQRTEIQYSNALKESGIVDFSQITLSIIIGEWPFRIFLTWFCILVVNLILDCVCQVTFNDPNSIRSKGEWNRSCNQIISRDRNWNREIG